MANFRELAEEYIKGWSQAQTDGVEMTVFIQGCLSDASADGAEESTLMRMEAYLRQLIRRQMLQEAKEGAL
jgi:hypothetical protein